MRVLFRSESHLNDGGSSIVCPWLLLGPRLPNLSLPVHVLVLHALHHRVMVLRCTGDQPLILCGRHARQPTHKGDHVPDQGIGMGFAPRWHRAQLDTVLDDPELFRSEEHTSELQSLMRISYAVFCLKKK